MTVSPLRSRQAERVGEGACTAAPQQEFRRSDFQKRVVEEEADGLRLLIGVGGPGAFVAAFCNRAKIVLADVNRHPSKSVAGPFPERPHSLGRCRHSVLPFVERTVARKPFQGVNGQGARDRRR